jgi:HNH endonuclease
LRKRSWSLEQLAHAVETSASYRQVLLSLNLRAAGGNYRQLHKYIRETGLETAHFTGHGWSRGRKFDFRPRRSLEEILTVPSDYPTFRLKHRLFAAGLKPPRCEECRWAETTPDGYLPLELDHINGNPRDNRLENLKILCPNCHSLKPTHRGRKLRGRARVVKLAVHATLKMS